MTKAVFWKTLGVATTDMPLPVEIIANTKKKLGEDATELKFIVFCISKERREKTQRDIEKYFEVISEIKRFNLNQGEFENAIRIFVSKKEENGSALSSNEKFERSQRKSRSKANGLLPPPKIGMVLERLDPRRPGKCKIVDLNETYGTVEWSHQKRKTKIAFWNLRKPYLFKVVK